MAVGSKEVTFTFLLSNAIVASDKIWMWDHISIPHENKQYATKEIKKCTQKFEWKAAI